MKKIVAIAMFLIVGGAFVFANGQKETGEGGGTPANPEKVLYWTSMTPPDSITLKEMVDTYNKTHPGVVVEFVQVPGSETDVAKLMTAVRGGTGPDVYQLDRFTVAQRAAAGVLEDLTAIVQKKTPIFHPNTFPSRGLKPSTRDIRMPFPLIRILGSYITTKI